MSHLHIDNRFKPMTFESLDKKLNELREQHHPYIEAACIIPFLYKKDIDSEEELLGMYGNVRMSSDKMMIYVYPAREFPSGKTNEEYKICYAYSAYEFPELYSFDNITFGYTLGMSMGGIIDMVNPTKKMRYIYKDFKK